MGLGRLKKTVPPSPIYDTPKTLINGHNCEKPRAKVVSWKPKSSQAYGKKQIHTDTKKGIMKKINAKESDGRISPTKEITKIVDDLIHPLVRLKMLKGKDWEGPLEGRSNFILLHKMKILKVVLYKLNKPLILAKQNIVLARYRLSTSQATLAADRMNNQKSQDVKVCTEELIYWNEIDDFTLR
ncbi:unnamed protein product [Vicia faba]|uniref:Uncharacterized protein n=1 Tax=Vicia faba TaxID=3906 RepID=A0AAV1A5M0_VICFA|nr:unnamed protein product [Vicia faba]